MNCFTSYNPATGEPLGGFPIVPAADVDCAVETAAERSSAWCALPIVERCARLRRLHDRLADDADSLAATLNLEIGKPLQDAYAADVLATLTALNWLIRQAPRLLHQRLIELFLADCNIVVAPDLGKQQAEPHPPLGEAAKV